jgi:hypothetical protein
MTSKALRNYKADKEEQERQDKILTIVDKIYFLVIETCEYTINTNYLYEIPYDPQTYESQGIMHWFYKENMKDILDTLKLVFPDSRIQHKTFIKCSDTKIYDMSKLDENIIVVGEGIEKEIFKIDPSTDQNARRIITRGIKKEYIDIDWS